MMKSTLYLVLIYQLAQLTHGFWPNQKMSNMIWTPPGCIACYHTEAKNYFQNLNRLSPGCAEQEINRFNWIPTKYFLHHICDFQTGTGFNSKFHDLDYKGNAILKEFKRCLRNRLSPTVKNYLKNFTRGFENARKTCKNEQFLEQGMKGIRQIYMKPLPPPSQRRQKRKREQLQNPSTEKLKPELSNILPSELSNILPSEHSDNLQENGETKKNETDVVNLENDDGTSEEISEPSLNSVDQKDDLNDTDPTQLEDSVETSKDEPSSIENSDNPQEDSEIKPNETDATSKENDHGAYEETPEPPSNTIEQQNDVDDTDPTTSEDSVDTLEDQPSSIITDNLAEKIQDEKILADEDIDSSEKLKTPNDQPVSHASDPLVDESLNDMTSDDFIIPGAILETSDDQLIPQTTNTSSEIQNDGMNPENIHDSTNNPSATLEDSSQIQTPNDQTVSHASDPLVDESLDNMTADDFIIPGAILETSDDQLIPPTTNTSPEIQNDEMNPENIHDSTNNPSAPLENSSQIQNDNLGAQVDPTHPPDDISSDNLYEETSEDQAPPVVTNVPEGIEENIPSMNNTPAEDSPQVQDDTLLAQDDPNLSIDEKSPENENVLAPLEETTKDQSASTINAATDDSPPVQENDTPEDTVKSSTNDDLFEETPEEIQSTGQLEIENPTEDFPLPQENNLQTGDDNSASSKIDAFSDNPIEIESLEEIIPQTNDSLAENLNKTEQEDSIITDTPTEALAETQLEDANESLPDPSSIINTPSENPSKIEENIPTPESISKSKPNNDATENSDETSNGNNEISPTDPASEPMNSVEQISSSTDDTTPSQDGITENTPQEMVADESPTSTLPQDDATSESPTKAELYAKFDNAMTHFATDKVVENDPKAVDEIISKNNSENIENNSRDEIDQENSVDSETISSSSDLNELKHQDLDKQDQNESTPTSLEDDAAKIEASDTYFSTNKASESPTNAELYEELHDPLTHFATDTVLENDPEAVEEIIFKDNPENIGNNSGDEDESNSKDSINSKTNSSSSDSSESKNQDLNKQDRNEPTFTSPEDDSAKIEASNESTFSVPVLENPPEKETADQNPEKLSPSTELTSSENSPIQEDTPKIELPEESESVSKEKTNDGSSISNDKPSHEQSEHLISEPGMNNEPENPHTTLSSTNDSTAQTINSSLEDLPSASSLPSENQTSIPQPNEPQKGQSESMEINPKTVEADQVYSKENHPSIPHDNVSQEKRPKSEETDLATNETSTSDLPNANPIPTEREIEIENHDQVEGKPKEIKDDILDYEKEKTVIS